MRKRRPCGSAADSHAQSQAYTDEQLILAARLYFLDGLQQAQIGRLVNVS